MLETAAMLRRRYDGVIEQVIDIIALWWVHNDIRDLTDAQSHMDELLTEVETVLGPAYTGLVDDMTELFADVYAFNLSYSRYIYGLEDESSDPLALFAALGLASLAWTDDGLTYGQRMALRHEQLKESIRLIITRGAASGLSTRRILDMVEKEMGKAKYRGTNVLVDESNHFANEAVKQVGMEHFDGYEISEVLDMKTCSWCRTMHGRRYKWDEYMVGVTAPMFHNSCRGRIIPINIKTTT